MTTKKYFQNREGILMAYLYLCKVNVNEKLYKMDNPDKIIKSYLNDIMTKIDINLVSALPKNKGKIKFITLDKNFEQGYITGRLIKIFTDDLKVYDTDSDDLIDLPNDKLARNATFYFDVRHELVAFTVGQYFGKIQFCEYFERLLNDHIGKNIFNVSLRLNEDEFREKLKTFQKIVRINVSIIPKNPGKDDINNWYATPESIKEVEAIQLDQTYITNKDSQTGLNINNDHMNNIINGVSSGYGKMKVTGIGIAGDEYTVNSDKDAAEKKYISNNQKYSIYSVMELGKDFITNILTKNIRKNN